MPVQVGSGALTYTDYIAQSTSGERTITVSGTVKINTVQVGTASGSILDNYGAT